MYKLKGKKTQTKTHKKDHSSQIARKALIIFKILKMISSKFYVSILRIFMSILCPYKL